MEKIEMLNTLIEHLGVKKTLEELVDALTDDEMKSNFEFICRMNDIPMDEEDEDDDDWTQEEIDEMLEEIDDDDYDDGIDWDELLDD